MNRRIRESKERTTEELMRQKLLLRLSREIRARR